MNNFCYIDFPQVGKRGDHLSAPEVVEIAKVHQRSNYRPNYRKKYFAVEDSDNARDHGNSHPELWSKYCFGKISEKRL